MRNLQSICWAIEWCCKCDTLNMWKNPCHDENTGTTLAVPDHIPDDQILKYLERKDLV